MNEVVRVRPLPYTSLQLSKDSPPPCSYCGLAVTTKTLFAYCVKCPFITCLKCAKNLDDVDLMIHKLKDHLRRAIFLDFKRGPWSTVITP